MTHDAPVTWMPIETAPKDGTFILLHEILAQPPVSVGCYDHECGWLIAEADFMPSKCIPHHWMPLPAAPVADRVFTSSPVVAHETPETSDKLAALQTAAEKLAGYAGHDDDCQIMNHGVWTDSIPCTCGYTDAWWAYEAAKQASK